MLGPYDFRAARRLGELHLFSPFSRKKNPFYPGAASGRDFFRRASGIVDFSRKGNFPDQGRGRIQGLSDHGGNQGQE
jgi:hypothetical protein